MKETTLEFTVAVKANEATLHHLQNQLDNTHAHHSVLSEVLPVMIKETLRISGAPAEVEIELHPSHLISNYDGIGGLTGDLWLKTNDPDYHLNDELIFLKAMPQDEILCSD